MQTKILNFFIFTVLIFSCLFYNFQIDEDLETLVLTSFTADTTKASELMEAAETLSDYGDYEIAIERLEAAKRLYEAYELWEKAVECTVNQSRKADYIDSQTKSFYANEALQTAQAKLVKNHIQTGKAYQQVAEVQIMQENYDSSIVYLNQALSIFKNNEEWSAYVWTTITKGICFYYKGEIELFKKELLIAQEYFEKYELDKEIYITTIDLLALVYDEEGDFDKAIENTKNSIYYYLQQPNITSADSNTIANNFLNISNFYSGIGAFQKSDNYSLKAMKFNNSEDPLIDLYALHALCDAAAANYNYQKSIDYGHQCLSIINQIEANNQDKWYMIIYSYIGTSFRYLNDYDSSKYYLELAISFPDNDYTAATNIDYAELLLEQKKYDEALAVLKKLQNINEVDNSIQALINRNIGSAYGQKGDFHKAMAYFQKMLHVRIPTFVDTLNPYANPITFGLIKEPVHFLKDLKEKAYIISQFPEKQQNLEAALATYDLAFQYMDTLLQKYAFDDSRIIHNNRNQAIYERAIEVANQLYQQTKDEKYIYKAFTYAEKVKSNILLADLQIDKNQAIIPTRIEEREKDLSSNILFYERQLETAKKDSVKSKIKLYQNYLTDYRIDLSELKDSIRNNYAKYYELKYSTVLAEIPTIQTELKADEGFISYYSGDSITYVFTITNDHIAFEKVAKTNLINKEVAVFRQMLKAPNKKDVTNDFKNYNQTSNQLYQTILVNSISNFNKNINKLIIIPDGTLNYIPFETLTNKVIKGKKQNFSEMPYLLYNYQIQYAYSATLLRENKIRQNQLKSNSKCLAYAPIYKNKKGIQRGIASNLRDNVTQLENTSKEIEHIATYFDGEFNQTETATKANFIEAAPDFGILHLAMHGEANYENEKFANLKFTNTKNQSKEDYLLYQGEIANMNLNAQLVVLSACETGVGKYLQGEGIASLGRSFMYAGVPSIVMSLWKVDDKATSQLMAYFYENLAKGMSKSNALHQAKLTFLRKEDFSNLHPNYWAGFITIGDIQPIRNKNKSYILYGFIALAISILSAFLWFFNKKSK